MWCMRLLIEIQKFVEDDDEDFLDIFGFVSLIVEQEESVYGFEDGGFMFMFKVFGNFWFGDDEDEDDFFVLMDLGWDEMDFEVNIVRDKYVWLV